MKPTRPGYYWFRLGLEWEPAKVYADGGELRVRCFLSDRSLAVETLNEARWGPEIKQPQVEKRSRGEVG